MSESNEGQYDEKVKEFKLELEYLIAGMIIEVPLSAIKKAFGSDDMAAIVAKVRAQLR